MCGIVGVVGTPDAASILLEGLKRLEYRGYDSAGIVILTPDSQNVVKEKGKIVNLEAAVDLDEMKGTCGISHTRVLVVCPVIWRHMSVSGKCGLRLRNVRWKTGLA